MAIPWGVVLEILKRGWVGLRAAVGMPAPAPRYKGGGSYPPTPGVDRRAILEGKLQGAIVGGAAGAGVSPAGKRAGVGVSSEGAAVGSIQAQGDVVLGDVVTVTWAGDVAGGPVAGSVDVVGLPADAGGDWTQADVRSLVVGTLSGERLSDLAFDLFPTVWQSYSAGMSYGDRARRLVEVAFLDGEVPYLLLAIKQVNPRGFDRHVQARALGGAGLPAGKS